MLTPKELLLGRAQRSDKLHSTLLPKRIALPVFASDALSSVSYATQEILLVLSLGGLAFFAYSPWVALGVVAVMLVVVASYRQNVQAYPSGGGDYEVVTKNLGPNAGLTVASALLVDYILTVAVSMSAASANIASAIPWFGQHLVALTIGMIIIVTLLNLRGVRESGTLFAIPTYAFIFGIFAMIITAAVRWAAGDTMLAESANWEIEPEATFAGAALVFLLARAFSSGCTALTGVEAISNGVPAFRKPKSKNAAATLVMLGVLSVTMFMSITILALVTKVKVAENNADLIGLPPGEDQKTVIAQIAQAVFSNFPVMFIYVSTVTALILVLAANTAFNGFPVLGSILAQDNYLPRQLHNRGDRLAFSNGIVSLAFLAIVLVYIFEASVTALIQLYIVGVFISFTLSQLGMIRHWTRLLSTEEDPTVRGQYTRRRIVNSIGFVMTGSVLVIVLATKFTRGAWIVCIAIPVLFIIMKAIQRHYEKVAIELTPLDDERFLLPARVHAIVLVAKIHKPTLRALAYARATRPSTLEALTVEVSPGDSEAIIEEWERREIPVSLKVLESPYREITKPVVDYVRNFRRASPRDLVTVYVPEYVVGHWWEHLLHNQSALRLKSRLLFTPGVMVVSVPWQLESSDRVADKVEAEAPGAIYRGIPAQPRD
ncbi:MAG TPA: APC family permease [Actinomycetota bacterium]|nr:APC family permease [Actinomycetota bacterium]HNL52101.1 APC family permease [Actinomycetota bacterium]HNO16026.1 APC family permease [Actinomycetota bacterium]HUM87189.1 APC family permease [Actinomycetota bacterium]